MRAVVIRRFGDPAGMELAELPSPHPAAGSVLIETEAIGVGGVDAVIRRGTLAGYGFREGLVPGSEVAGTVIGVGEDVDRGWIGTRVWAFTGLGGGYAEQAPARLADITVLPQMLSPIDAVTLGSAGPVAHFALQHAHVAPGETVLVRGASGSIGIAAVQLAARAGARAVAVTASAPERGRRLRELGATHVLDRSGHGGPDAPGLFDVIIDVVGGPDVPSFIERLAPGGRMVAVGAIAGPPPVDFGMRLLGAFQKSLTFSTFSLATIPETARNLVRAELFEAASRGELHTIVDDVLGLDEAAEAHRRMDAGTVFGRVVLTPSSGRT